MNVAYTAPDELVRVYEDRMKVEHTFQGRSLLIIGKVMSKKRAQLEATLAPMIGSAG